MPIFKNSVTAPTQYDGLTAATGLFNPGASTGGASLQVRVNSISFSGASAITDWTLALVDPATGQSTTVLTDTTTDFAAGGPGGFLLMPTNSDGQPWRLTFVTTGMTGTGLLAIDHDIESTEG